MAYRSKQSDAQTTATWASSALPAGWQPGDSCFAFLVEGTTALTVVTPAAGWSLLFGPFDSAAGTVRAWVYFRILRAGDTAPTWVMNNPTSGGQVDLVAYSGRASVNPIVASGAAAPAQAAPPGPVSSASIDTGTVDACDIVAAVATDGNNSIANFYTFGAGVTERFEFEEPGTFTKLGIADGVRSPAGSGSFDVSWVTETQAHVLFIFALRPAFNIGDTGASISDSIERTTTGVGRLVKCSSALSTAPFSEPVIEALGPYSAPDDNAVHVVAHTADGTFGPDCEVSLTVSTLGEFSDSCGARVGARLDASGNGYWFRLANPYLSGAAAAGGIYKRVAGVDTQLAALPTPLGPGERILLRCLGRQISAWIHNPGRDPVTPILLMSVQDGTFTAAGYPGYGGYNSSSRGGGVSPSGVEDLCAGAVVTHPSYLEFVLPSPEAEAYVEMEIAYPQATLDDWAAVDSVLSGPAYRDASPPMASLFSDGQPDPILSYNRYVSTGWNGWGWQADQLGGNFDPRTYYEPGDAVVDELRRVRWHIRPDTDEPSPEPRYSIVSLDDQLGGQGLKAKLTSPFFESVPPLTKVRFGLDNWVGKQSSFSPTPSGLADPNSDVWIGKIKVGTSWGASDLLDFDPATAADLSQFTVVGNCAFDFYEGDAFPPTLDSAEVRYRLLTLTFDEPLNRNRIPEPAAFDVQVNASPVGVVKTGWLDDKILLHLDQTVAVGDAVTVEYVPGTDPIADVIGNPAAAFGPEAVSNVTPAGLPNAVRLHGDVHTRAEPLYRGELQSNPQYAAEFHFGRTTALIHQGRHARVYATFQVYVPQAALDRWYPKAIEGGNTRGPRLYEPRLAASASQAEIMLHVSGGAFAAWRNDAFGFPTIPGHVDVGWHTIKAVQLSQGAEMVFSVDGESIDLDDLDDFDRWGFMVAELYDYGFFGLGNNDVVRFGGDLYFGRILLGTWDGGADILDFDPATSPALSGFRVEGFCEIDKAPSAPSALAPTGRPSDGAGNVVAVNAEDERLYQPQAFVIARFAPTAELYWRVELAFTAEALLVMQDWWGYLVELLAQNFTPGTLDEYGTTVDGEDQVMNGVYIRGVDGWTDDDSDDSIADHLEPDVIHVVEGFIGDLAAVTAADFLVAVDGDPLPFTPGPFVTNQGRLMNKLRVGLDFTPATLMVRKIEVGTTLGGSDLFSFEAGADDLSSLDLVGFVEMAALESGPEDAGATISDSLASNRRRSLSSAGASVSESVARGTGSRARAAADVAATVEDVTSVGGPFIETPEPPEPWALLEAARNVLDDLPPYLADEPRVQRLVNATVGEFARIERAANQTRATLSPTTADDRYRTLGMWEQTLGLPVELPGATVEERRAKVIALVRARRAGSGASWIELLTLALGSSSWTYFEGPGDYQVTIEIPSEEGSFTAGQVSAIARAITPAHIDVIASYGTGFLVGISEVGVEPL